MVDVLNLVQYDAGGVEIKLDPNTVRNYLVRGNGNVTDQEVLFFMRTCEAQKLNPLAYGEVYLIKFGTEPAQLVIGKETYMKRAFKNPNYNGMKSGIVVQRGDEIIQKEGTCLYPSETLIGGWCRVFHELNGKEVETFKEVALSEYQKLNKEGKPAANWGNKPCTMVEKVAVSQAIRAAFPDDYQGLYTAEEFGYTDREAENRLEMDGKNIIEVEQAICISQEQRKELLGLATEFYGSKKGEDVIRRICEKLGLESTANMTTQQFDKAMEMLNKVIHKAKEERAARNREESENMKLAESGQLPNESYQGE